MDLNQETVLDALNDFERKPIDIPPILEDYLLRIARNGEILFPWGKLKPLLKRKLEVVCDEFNENNQEEIPDNVPNFESFHFDTLKKSILQAVEAFTSAPFTIQRLCELVTNPKKHYNRTDKYMRGIVKNVLVVSTIEPRIGVQNDSNANASPVVNGIPGDSPRDDNCFDSDESNEIVSSSNLNSPANHVLLDNFANVFPTAACIPSPSNICINRDIDSLNREIDSNFIPNAECVQTQEVEYGPVPIEIPESDEPKEEEQMDTTSEESSSMNETCEATPAEPTVATDEENDAKIETEEQDDTKPDVQVDSDLSNDENLSSVNENVSASENVKNEAESSDVHTPDVPLPEKELSEPQDDTVSQSDDNTCDINDVSQSDEVCESGEAESNEESIKNASEVSQSIASSDSSGQCMELESSSSEEPAL